LVGLLRAARRGRSSRAQDRDVQSRRWRPLSGLPAV